MKSDSINCSGYEIGDEGIKKLLEFIIKKNLEQKINNSNKKGNFKYQELKLSRCGITNDALIYIKSIMEVCKNTIMHLNLSRNNIDSNGVNILCSIIQKNPQLKDLKLSKNNINTEGKKIIEEFIIKKNLEQKISTTNKRGNVRYKELKLSRCGITNDALIYIKSIMEVCKNTIMHLNLSRNNIDTNGINMLCSIIQKNPQLKDLKLSKNNINQNGKEMIEECIKQNNSNLKLEI